MIKAVQAAENGQNRPLGRPPKQRDQRNRILREAAQIIAQVGYEKCSLARIAKGLGLSAPALYHYFPTKQSIFSEIAMFVVCGIYDYVREGLESDASPGEQLRVMMRRHAAYFDDQYWMMNATIAGYAGIARRDIQGLQEFEAHRLRYEKLLHGILRAGVRSGEFRTLDIKSVARSILQLLNITRWYQPGGAKSAVDFAEENFDLVYRSLLAPGAREPNLPGS